MMGFFSDIDIEISDMVANGATRTMVANSYPMLREDEIDAFFGEPDYSITDTDASDEDEEDGQPTMYEEYQDLHGGDDWDQGQYDYE
jgi:hypothetical protein